MVIPFVLWTLALAHLFRLLKKRTSYGLSVTIGVLLWFVRITTIDDYWIFSPFSCLLSWDRFRTEIREDDKIW